MLLFTHLNHLIYVEITQDSDDHPGEGCHSHKNSEI